MEFACSSSVAWVLSSYSGMLSQSKDTQLVELTGDSKLPIGVVVYSSWDPELDKWIRMD